MRSRLGGCHSTGLGRRSAVEAAATDTPADYAPFVAAGLEMFEALAASLAGATGEEVAEVIFTAATDGTDQLRYIGTEEIKPLIAARRETSVHV